MPLIFQVLSGHPTKQALLLATGPWQGVAASVPQSHKWGERDPDAGLFRFKVRTHNDPLTLSSCHSDNQGDEAARVGSEAFDLQSKCGFGEPLVACGVMVLT